MAFSVFTQATTISADDVNNNFYHIGQGNFTPRDGLLLEETSGALTLGSDTYKWNTLYCEHLHASSSNEPCWHMITEVTITSNTTAVTFSGLNGDSGILYELQHMIKLPTYLSVVRLIFNGDSSTNYCTLKTCVGVDNLQYNFLNTDTAILLVGSDASSGPRWDCYTWLIYAKTGYPRQANFEGHQGQTTTNTYPYVRYTSFGTGMWGNQVQTLTNMTIYVNTASGILIGSIIRLWGRSNI